MKKLNSLAFILAFLAMILQTSLLKAQDDKASRPSPPAEAKATIGKTDVIIAYSQPAVKGRKIWGDLVPYGKVWRTGANEATTFEVSTDIEVEGKTLKAGKYGLFTIPGENEWIIIFNSVADQWGAFNYNSTKDVLRVNVKPKITDASVERFTIAIEKGEMVTLSWEKLVVGFKISVK